MISWDRLDDLTPAAEAVGPFPRRPFLETWWRHRGEDSVHLVESGSSIAVVTVSDGVMSFAGDPDVTDYHTPLGEDPGAVIAAALTSAPTGTSRFRFDSMPEEVATPVAESVTAAGFVTGIERHEAAMVVALDAGNPFGSLDAKQRHEVRRKTRRFVEAHGEPALTTGDAGFDAFVAMHRMAEGDKGGFMTVEMEAFFRDLLAVPGATVDVLVTGNGAPVAAAFGFVDDDAYYLYNSAFDPDVGAVSPGTVLVAMLIERESSGGRRRFDFLKGTESYKFRLGARPRDLFVVEGVL